MHPQLRKSYVLLSCPILVVSDPRLSIDSQEYACNRSSIPITLVVRQAIPFRMTRRNKLQYLFHIQDWVKEVVLRRSNANPAFALFYLGVLPSLNRDCYRNCTPSYELLVQWYFLPSLVIPRSSCWCNRNTDKWIVMCEINTASNSVAW